MIARAVAVAVALVASLAFVSACGGDDGSPGSPTPSTTVASPAPSTTSGGTTPDPSGADGMIMYRDSIGDLIVRSIGSATSRRQTVDYSKETVVTATCTPDGSKIAYLKQFFDQPTNRTLIVRGEGAPEEPYDLPSLVQDIAWSPDGTRVAFSEWDGVQQTAKISYLDLASADATQLTGGDDYPGGLAWSPDGSLLAYFLQDIAGQGSAIYVLPLDGGDPEKVTSDDTIDWLDPNWAPDGKSLVASGIADGGTQIYRIDLATHESVPITTSDDIFKRGPEISPDGSLIAYTGSIILPGVSVRAVALHTFGIFLVNTDGSDEHALTADPRLNPGAQVDPYLDAFLLGWCAPGPWLDDLWVEEEQEATQ